MSLIDFNLFCQWGVDEVNIQGIDIEKYLIDMKKEYPPVDFLLQYNGVGCIPKGDLQAMTGKMKNGKSFACLCLEVAMLNGSFMGFEALKENIHILHVDTEQSPATIVKRAKALHTMCEWDLDINDERYRTIHLRECNSCEERLKVITEAIEKFNPDFMFIDGIRDLLDDFNDPQQSSRLINYFLMLCNKYKVGIMCVLHENKGDTNMRGHLGTELGNKCSETYKTSKSDDIIKVEQTVCRNEPIKDWGLSIGDNGIPITQSISNVNPTRLKRDNSFKALYKEKESYTHTELWNAFAQIYGCKERAAKTHIANALNDGTLQKRDDTYYYGVAPIDTESFNF